MGISSTSLVGCLMFALLVRDFLYFDDARPIRYASAVSRNARVTAASLLLYFAICFILSSPILSSGEFYAWPDSIDMPPPISPASFSLYFDYL